MPQPNDLSRSFVALDQDTTIIAVVELSQSSWLIGGIVPGIERQPHKKLEPSPERLLAVLHRWRDEAVRAGRKITRIALAFEAGRDGFWLARWLRARGVEAHVIHPSSVAVSREHRRAKTDRLDTELLKRGFLGWLRGERGHCSMARVPTSAEEDAKRPNRERECLVRERTRIVNRMKGTLARLGIRNFKPTLRKAAERLATLHTPEGSVLPPNVSAELQRDMARLGFVVSQIKEIEGARQKRLEQEPETQPHAMVRHLARVVGVGVETADILVHEVLSRPMRDRRAVARYAGLTGSPDESGAKRREQGLARAGNARVRRAMIQLAWRFLRFQKESALARWYRARTADSRIGTRKTMIVALARKLVIALWRFVTTGETLEGVILRPGLGVVDEDELYSALDWLTVRQPAIEAALAKRHFTGGTLVLYDVSSSYLEGHCCPLAQFGYSRDGKRGKRQIVYGLLCAPDGCPVAIEVFAGSTADPTTLTSQVTKLKERFSLDHVVLVGDRGMITQARISEDIKAAGLDWITALRALAIKALREAGALQMSLFDERDMASITSPDFPGERLIVCRNPSPRRLPQPISLLEEAGFEPVWGFSCQVVIFGL